MQLNRIQTIKAKITEKIQYGDYVTLSKILGLKRTTAVSKYERDDEFAVSVMYKIVMSRESLIKKLTNSMKKDI